MSLFNFLLIIINTIILVSGQFLWKVGLLQQPFKFNSIGGILKLLFSPYIFSGLCIYGLATVLWLFILTRVPLSIAYPLQSLAYLFTMIGASLLFNEPITLSKIIGVLFIITGVSIIGVFAS